MSPESQLAELAIRGRPRFPDLCANCCQPAARRLPVEKVFEHFDEDDGSEQVLVRFQVGFCGPCAAQHFREVQPPGLGRQLWRVARCLAALLPAAALLFIAWLLRDLIRLWVSEAPASRTIYVFLGAAVIAGITGGYAWWTWRTTRWMSRVAPTSITSAVDFTDDESEAFEPAWRTFRFRNRDYAVKFRDANRERIWKPGGPRWLAARWLRRILIAAMLVIGGFLAFEELWEQLTAGK